MKTENNFPLISIIIPVYNVEKYVSQCIESVINQTYNNIEVILVDDGSTDNSGQICDDYAKKDSRITVIHKKNGGLSDARNHGMKRVTGDYIAFVDGDDWVSLNWCEKTATVLADKPVDILLWSYVREYPENSINCEVLPFKDITTFSNYEFVDLFRRILGPINEEIINPAKLDNLTPVWNKMYGKKCLFEKCFVDTKIIGTEDLLFNLQCLGNAENAIYIPGYFYHYRKSVSTSLTSVYKDKFLSQRKTLYNYIEKSVNRLKDEDFQLAFQNRKALEILGHTMNIVSSNLSFSEKKREMSKVLNDSVYSQPLQKLDLHYMPIYWKVFYGCAKRKMSFSVIFIGKCINYMRKIR